MKRTALKRKSGLKARPPRHPKMTAEENDARLAFVLVGLNPCAVCGYKPPVGLNASHHIVYKSKLKAIGRADALWDLRNALPLCRYHHDGHHGTHPIPRELLPDRALEFAARVLGEPAGDWLARRYL